MNLIRVINLHLTTKEQLKKFKMILPPDYVKSFQDHRNDKRLVHSQKILKNRIKNLLPNEASIKLFYSQHEKNINQSQMLNLYHFQDIPKSQYERILSNPLYFLQNERNFRMFRFFLIKNGHSQNRIQGSIDEEKMRNRKASLISNGQSLMNYQFIDKTKINYQQPWKYIETTLKKMKDQTKETHRKLSTELDTKKRRKPSISIDLDSKYQNTSKKHFINKHKDLTSPNVSKHLSTSFIFKIKQRQENISKIKKELFQRDLEKANTYRINFYSKLLDCELRVKKIKEKDAIERNKIKSISLIKTEICHSQKKLSQELGPEMKSHLHKLKKVCVRTVYEKSQSLLNLNLLKKSSKQFIPVSKLKEIKAKQRKEILKDILQKRIGIEDSSKELNVLNPEKDNK